MNKLDDNKKYKVTIYDDERIKVQYNPYSLMTYKQAYNNNPPLKLRNDMYPFMTIKQYKNQLRYGRKKCANLKLIPNRCTFLTLTTTQIFNWEELKVKFESFIRCIKRNFGKIYYVRVIESFKDNIHYHIHLIIMFSSIVPNDFNENWVNKHWKHGLSDFQKVIEPYGILDYITQYKKNDIKDDRYTKFPQFVKLITRSLDFPESQKVDILANKDDIHNIIEFYNNKCKNETGYALYKYDDGHYYLNYGTGEYKYCLDSQYYHKPFVEDY